MYRISIIFLFFLFSCNQQNEKETEKDHTVTKSLSSTVEVSLLKNSNFSDELIVNAKIESAHWLDLFSVNSGVIHKLSVNNGSIINKGDTIAVLENEDLKINIGKSRIALFEAENELSSLMLGFGGNAYDTTSVKKDILKSLKVRSGYSRALLDVKMAQLNYENSFVVAPINGKIADLNFKISQRYQSNEPLCKIIDHQNFLVKFYITESELPQIKIGQTIKVDLLNNSIDNLSGTITEINPIVDEHSLIMVVGQLAPTSNYIISGMNAKVIIEDVKENCLVIPKKALVIRNNKKVVFTYKSGKAYWNYVETKAENSTSYLVSQGLIAGDTVIVDGNLNLAHDAEVIISEK